MGCLHNNTILDKDTKLEYTITGHARECERKYKLNVPSEINNICLLYYGDGKHDNWNKQLANDSYGIMVTFDNDDVCTNKRSLNAIIKLEKHFNQFNVGIHKYKFKVKQKGRVNPYEGPGYGPDYNFKSFGIGLDSISNHLNHRDDDIIDIYHDFYFNEFYEDDVFEIIVNLDQLILTWKHNEKLIKKREIKFSENAEYRVAVDIKNINCSVQLL